MSSTTRRRFLAAAGTLAAAATVPVLANATPMPEPKKDWFIHHVYFWLKNPDSAADKQKLIEGLRSLTGIRTIQLSHIGQPADTHREVIDRSYAVSWMLVFRNGADQESYQKDPVHLAFVDKYSHLWERVVVYDSVDA